MNFKEYIDYRKDIKLSGNQTLLINKLNKFLIDKKGPQCFILTGSAGSGKTFVGSLVKEFFSSRTYIFTPTGRAAKIFRSMVRNPKDRDLISTIHNGIYSRTKTLNIYMSGKEKKPENIEKTRIIFDIQDNLNSNNAVYICDESSMISDQKNFNSGLEFGTGRLLSDLFTHIEKRKIIFIGDNAQLTPINMNFSPALNKSYIEKKFGISVEEFNLNEVVRQKKESGILKNATLLRKNVLSRIDKKVNLATFNDVQSIHSDRAVIIAKESFIPSSFTDFVVVTHSRALSFKYNKKIRKYIYPNAKDKIIKNDRLVCAQSNYRYGIFNGEMLLVKKVCNDENSRIVKTMIMNPSNIEKKQKKFKFNNQGKLIVDLVFQELIIEFHDQKGRKEDKKCYVLENALDTDYLTIEPIVYRALLADLNMRYNKSKKKFMRDNNFTDLSEYQENLAIKKGQILDRDKDIFFNALITKYGYSLTAHKAQGGEWDNVIVDMSTGHRDNIMELLRWQYTSMTRAKNNLFLVNYALSESIFDIFDGESSEEDYISEESVKELFTGNDNIDFIPPEKSNNERIGNAYTPWDRKDDEILSLYFELKKPILEIAAKMKRSKGAIRARLIKLGLIKTTKKFIEHKKVTVYKDDDDIPF